MEQKIATSLDDVRAEYQKWVTYCVNRCVENGAEAEDITLHKEDGGEFAPTVVMVKGEPIVRVILYSWAEYDGRRFAQIEVQERKWDDE